MLFMKSMMMIKIDDQTREKLEVLSQCLNNFADDCTTPTYSPRIGNSASVGVAQNIQGSHY